MSYRLLTEEEIAATRHYNPTTNGCYQVNERAVAKAQDKKTVAIRDKEWREKIEAFITDIKKADGMIGTFYVEVQIQRLLSEMEGKQ
jgi:hypothetical protein